MDPSAASEALITGLGYMKVSHYAHLCSSCIIFFEHLITLDDELLLVWPSPWTPGKILFLLNRYYPLATVIFNTYALFGAKVTETFCLRYFQWQGWSGLVAYAFATGILQLRIYSMYYLDRRMLAFTATFFILAVSMSGLVFSGMMPALSTLAINLNNHEAFCIPIGLPTHAYMFFVPLLAFDLLLCLLALFRGYQTFRSESRFYNGRMLVVILIRDSVLYFVAICATNSTALLVWILAPPGMAEVPVLFPVAASCVFGNRVLLNVRKARPSGLVVLESSLLL